MIAGYISVVNTNLLARILCRFLSVKRKLFVPRFLSWWKWGLPGPFLSQLPISTRMEWTQWIESNLCPKSQSECLLHHCIRGEIFWLWSQRGWPCQRREDCLSRNCAKISEKFEMICKLWFPIWVPELIYKKTSPWSYATSFESCIIALPYTVAISIERYPS
jgi:hypothetical protein